MSACLLSAVRNEGPDLLEWIAWHRLIGFDRLAIWSNDCTDGSDDLLDALQAIGWIRHFRHSPTAGASVQGAVATHAFADPWVMGSDWLMWLDADEFLVIHAGKGRLVDLMAEMGGADGIAVNWRLFGDAGYDRSPAGLVVENFTQASLLRYRLNRSVKTLHRIDDRITGLFIHRPLWRDDPARPVRLITGDGAALGADFLFQPKKNGNPQEMVEKRGQSWRLAQVNHYATKALERVAAKKLRGDGLYADWSSRFDFRYLKRFNKNDEPDTSAHRHLPALRAMMDVALSVPAVAEAHAACAMRFQAMLDGLADATAWLATDRTGAKIGDDQD